MPEVDVLDTVMYYEEAGDGDPIVFLHGNPTSSYLWRDVRPKPTRSGRGNGRATPVPVIEWCRNNVANLEIQACGRGIHFVQEDAGPAIADAVGSWRRRVLS